MTNIILSNGKMVPLDKLSQLKPRKSVTDIMAQSDIKGTNKFDKMLVVLLDTSGSMIERLDATKTKIEAAWSVFHDVLAPNMGNWPYGIITFGHTDPHWEVYPTTDTKALVTTRQLLAMGSTPMGKALQLAWGWVKINAKQARFILLSDGFPTDLSDEHILRLAQENKSIPIDTVGIGTSYSLSGYNAQFLRDLSRITSGKFSEVSTVKALGTRILELSPAKRPMLGTVKSKET